MFTNSGSGAASFPLFFYADCVRVDAVRLRYLEPETRDTWGQIQRLHIRGSR